MIDSFEFRWKQWRQQTPPFEAFRFGNRSSPTYNIEASLDHVRTTVVMVVDGYWKGRGWDTRSQIAAELGNLGRIESAVASLPADVKQAELMSWIRSTRGMLRCLYDDLQPHRDRFVDFPELTKDTPPFLVASVLVDLIEGRITREQVAGWAAHYVRLDDPPAVDKRIWEAVGRMSGADSPSTDRQYLYGLADFEEWLRELNAE